MPLGLELRDHGVELGDARGGDPYLGDVRLAERAALLDEAEIANRPGLLRALLEDLVRLTGQAPERRFQLKVEPAGHVVGIDVEHLDAKAALAVTLTE